jgi:hypothetical protein
MSLGNGSQQFFNNGVNPQFNGSILPNQAVSSTDFGKSQMNFYSTQVGGGKRRKRGGITKHRRRSVGGGSRRRKQYTKRRRQR